MDLRIDQWDIDLRPWGWLRLREASNEGPTVYLHYGIAGSEGQKRPDLEAVVLRSGAGEALSGRVWRRIPFSDIERLLTIALINPPLGISEDSDRGIAQTQAFFIEGVPDVQAPSLDSLDDFFEATEELTLMHMNPMPSGMIVAEDQSRFPQIKPPEGRLTDEFLQDVADAYRWFADRDMPPAPSIAEVSGAPVRTVHRWIYEARKRGILPPARTGRAG